MDVDAQQSEPAALRVSLVMTVLNDAAGTSDVLETLTAQTRGSDEVIVVDGGSTDGTIEAVCHAAKRNPAIRLIHAPGTNIARGRNIGIESASGEIIALTDSGCRLDPAWVQRIIAPFEEDPETEFAAGFYEIDPRGLLEAVAGLATMRGALDPVDPATFNPSCRSMAFTRRLWERAGGFPEWLYTAEDTLFDYKVRRMKVNWRFAKDAVVYWRPRTTLSALYRQFRGYATGSAQIGEGLRDALYHARNLALVAAFAIGGFFYTPFWIPAVVVFAYFYVYAYHRKSRRIAARMGTWKAYPLSLVVHWLLVLAGLDGQLRALCRRRHVRQRYRNKLAAYLRLPMPNAG